MRGTVSGEAQLSVESVGAAQSAVEALSVERHSCQRRGSVSGEAQLSVERHSCQWRGAVSGQAQLMAYRRTWPAACA